MTSQKRGDVYSTLILLLASALGLWALLYPFLRPGEVRQGSADPTSAHSQDAVWVLLCLVGLCLLVVVANLETRRMDARLVAVLGVLVAINATVRLVSGPFGANAVFLLPILCGWVFGADFAFLLAALSMLCSAILTGGVGPWLPFQMFAAGWCAMVAGWLPRFEGRMGRGIVVLAVWGAIAGFLYSLVTNLWLWPYLAPSQTDHAWDPDLGLIEAGARFAAFYLATASWWAAGRALGNFVLVLAVGPPVARLLLRFQQRFRFQLEESEAEAD